ncbi:hypothetical protein SeLEV6574_g03471 [Synchytrium endobioticum]|uniref:N-alpha-acetyltransferase 40 n=1 Tax=Synchytrium endobioticum TaxID=286115 RepID=A0A507D3K7_9FUNG|nr:hypothetical protein SeLEV6574_g03471 [Synchytrium endobioticum]
MADAHTSDTQSLEEERVRIACQTPVTELALCATHPLRYTTDNLDACIALYTLESIPHALFDWCIHLIKRNLQHHYVNASDTGWSTPAKAAEMRSASPRYLVASTADPDGTGELPVGFVHFQFSMEEIDRMDASAKLRADTAAWTARGARGDPPRLCSRVSCVYCYEIQLEPDVQGSGLGTRLLLIMEDLARAAGMHKAYLTVFKSNVRAIAFYTRRGYTIDGISPSRCLPRRRAARCSYEIMSRVL